MLVPATLTGLCKLSDGMCLYRQTHAQSRHMDLVNAVIRSCEMAAAQISTRLPRRPVAQDPLDRQVWDWIQKTKDLLPGERRMD